MEQKSGKAEEKKEEETDALVQKRNRNNTKSKDQILLTVKVYHDIEDDLCWDYNRNQNKSDEKKIT